MKHHVDFCAALFKFSVGCRYFLGIQQQTVLRVGRCFQVSRNCELQAQFRDAWKHLTTPNTVRC